MSSELRHIPTRKTDCAHDLRVFLCNRNLWSCAKTLNCVRCKFAECKCTSDGILIICEWNALVEGLYRSKLENSVQLQTVLAIHDQQAQRRMINNWKQLWNFMLIRWWQLETLQSRVLLWKGDQSKETKPTLRGKWESVFSEGTRTMFQRRLM